MQIDKNIYKKGKMNIRRRTIESIKFIHLMCKLGDWFKKNTVLVWNWLKDIVSMLGSRGVVSVLTSTVFLMD